MLSQNVRLQFTRLGPFGEANRIAGDGERADLRIAHPANGAALDEMRLGMASFKVSIGAQGIRSFSSAAMAASRDGKLFNHASTISATS